MPVDAKADVVINVLEGSTVIPPIVIIGALFGAVVVVSFFALK